MDAHPIFAKCKDDMAYLYNRVYPKKHTKSESWNAIETPLRTLKSGITSESPKK